jgi:hypothetical protein
VILRQGDSAEARFMLGTAQLQRGDAVAAVAEFDARCSSTRSCRS